MNASVPCVNSAAALTFNQRALQGELSCWNEAIE